ncbi:hypothetical protein BBJ28_00022884 [Nothophytophthora sp. Chile5]|nr:hypothetical protein BBJ28_00022884 [Nothophytophthora sp. Chile5]
MARATARFVLAPAHRQLSMRPASLESQTHTKREDGDYDENTTADLLLSEEDEDDGGEAQTDGESLTQQQAKPPRVVRFEEDGEESAPYPRAVAAGVNTSLSPRSPLLKKFAPVEERRANTVVLETLHLIDLSRDEIGVIERSVKRIRDAILGFAMLVDKQVNIVGIESQEERGRIKADIQDLSHQLKASNALLEDTCDRMKKQLNVGRNQMGAHKRRLDTGRSGTEDTESEDSECTSPRCGASSQQRKPQPVLQPVIRFNRSPVHPTPVANMAPLPYGCSGLTVKSNGSPVQSGRSSSTKKSASPVASRSPPPVKVPLACILNPHVVPDDSVDGSEDPPPCLEITLELFVSLLAAVGLQEKEFLEPKDLTAILRELLAFSIARSPVLRFMDKAYHRRLLPRYASELADLLIQDLQLVPQLSARSPVIIPVNTLEDYMCMEPNRFDRLLLSIYVIPTDETVSDPSPTGFFTPPPFADAAAEAAATTFPTSPFKEQMTRNGGILNGGKVAGLVVNKPREPELLESAEQTLGMAKLLHDLATAECEARSGNRISIRASVPHDKEFSRAYIASAKELMLQETSFQ